MHSKKPSQEPFTLVPLSSSSIYHLRAACAKSTEDEAFQIEYEAEEEIEKVLLQLFSKRESD